MSAVTKGGIIMKEYDNVFDFQRAYPVKREREAALGKMTDGQIEKLVRSCGTVQGKIYYASFGKSGKKTEK